MKEILSKLEVAYLEYVEEYQTKSGYTVPKYECVGLCHVSYNSLSYEDCKLFQEYLDKYKKGRKVFYDCNGEKTFSSSQFIWTPKNIQARLDWLRKQIETLS